MRSNRPLHETHQTDLSVAIAVFVLWATVMPTTCMSGGLICSLVAMAVLFNTIGIVLAAVIRFVVSLFS